ncbi:Glycosyltransferase involved in cell wall bisynthesis [Chitinophaga sp. CF118]|uniref:glycosyltransferase family 2 protein n=1 Tax=Chitinophaga sp. CF118 TaxID=1884367 RepID=UPI0008F00D14|nr:glycosyltransferase family 2 protein [Chitinophaga sp. CF118]SFD30504.1 Glycosyltransferase involved in cell wall bisynthesis [Chitinophaga sp. CF118]
MSELQTTPLVSIVMGTYNGTKYLKEQLDSLIQQTYPNIEIIAVDDCSKDDTIEILKQYSLQHNNIRIFQNTSNLGFVKNFEKGASLATGAYISFCDQDDVWAPEKTTVLMNAIEDHPMIYCDSALVDQDLQPLWNHSDLKKLASFDNCLYFATDNCVGGHALIIKKEIALAAMPYPIEMAHDLWLAFFTTFYGSIKYYDVPFVKWRQHGNNFTSLKTNKKSKLEETRKRFLLFRDACPPAFSKEKKVFDQLYRSYESYSPGNNFLRMFLFFKYQNYLLAMKKRNSYRKFLFCLKMFFKMRNHV